MEEEVEFHFHVKKREKFKRLPMEGWFHPCHRCYTITGYEYFYKIKNIKYTYNLCYSCSIPEYFNIMKNKIKKYHKKSKEKVKPQEQNDD